MSSIKFVHEAIRDALSRHGFNKEGSVWRANKQETILVVEPDKSPYGDQFYIDLGVFLRQLGDSTKPREINCHIRGRIAGALTLEDAQAVKELLDFEQQLHEQYRHNLLVMYLDKFAAPLLGSCATLPGIRDALTSGKLRRFLVRKELLTILGLPQE